MNYGNPPPPPPLGGLPPLAPLPNNPMMMQPMQSIMPSSSQQQQPNQQDKINRELFVGNTPPGTSELLLQHFCNAAMRRVNLCQQHESPVINARVNNKFAFVELANADFANKCLNLNGIPFLNTYLKISRPSKYMGPSDIPGVKKTWQELTGQDSSQIPDPEMEKLQRELFVGNTTPEMTSQMLTEFLGNAMEQVQLTTRPGNPIVACRVSGKFAFVELRSAEETKNALQLNNIPYLGAALRVGRPSKYNGPTPDPPGNWEDVLAKFLSGEQQQQAPSPDAAAAAAAEATRIVELQHMVNMEDLEDDNEYQDILDDTREQCIEFGKLKQVIIPKKNELGATKIFLEYETTNDATNAIRQLQGRTFDGNIVQANYYDETKFANKEYA